MNEAFEQALNQLAEEKDINKEELLKMIEASLAAAFRKDYGKKDQNIVVEFMPETMGTKVYDVKKIVEEVVDPMKEWTLEQGKEHKKSAKIGAQTAKQVIVQKIREAERGVLFTDFKAKERQLVSGMVQRLEGDTVLVDLGKTTGVLFPSEQIKGEKYLVGARVKVLILHVEPTAKGPKITLSRSHPDVVRRLFELEVPEIFNGIVEIKAVAREAGSRTKIGVWSLQEGVDPIGACVGQRGSRVQGGMGELNGEKIDIISWAEDAVKDRKSTRLN